MDTIETKTKIAEVYDVDITSIVYVGDDIYVVCENGKETKVAVWYFKSRSCCEVFEIIWENNDYILVQNKSILVQNKSNNHHCYSFGLKRDFGTIYGFNVNWSCLTKHELLVCLDVLIEIDSKPCFSCVQEEMRRRFGYNQIDVWNAMKGEIL